FTLATPIAAAVAVRWFMPFYRRLGDVSAYEHLERRFGSWARTYAVVCFLLTQVARMAVVMYLLALAASSLTGWSVTTTILITGLVMTVYTLGSGINAVVWTGVVQSAVLIAGTLCCLGAVILQTPGGLNGIVDAGVGAQKFSLGGLRMDLTGPTFWVLLMFGLVTHLSNFGVDQSYVQRYISARSDREAAKSIWITALLYVPVAGVFFFIGTALYGFYGARPELLGSIAAPDEVFPHFIATQLPPGMAGLVVAAIFAASMDSNLNSMATLTLCDIYKRHWRPQAGERESLLVLRGSTIAWGVVGTVAALAMSRAGETTLDVWWKLAGLLSGGVLGLFLLGLCCRSVRHSAAAIATVIGVLATIWMALPEFSEFFEVPASIRNPLHANMTMVIATLTIFLCGLVLAKAQDRLSAGRGR
ncbi:MAG: sodium/solute symporter, partial [Pirellulales bacterium]|nr:sodium/solute symporter [Pirellulales bacterium]